MADPVRSAKGVVLDIVTGLPDDATYDEILQELFLKRKVEGAWPTWTPDASSRTRR